jgi:DNA-binding MarR family transcriptional regulator
MSNNMNNSILDAYASLRRELSLIFASQLKSTEFGHKQMVILYRLVQSPTSMSDLADFIQSDPAATTRAVAALEKVGYVKRVRDESDNRKTIIELTRNGQAKAAKASELRKVIGSMVNETLNPKERVLFAELLNKVANGLQQKTAQAQKE